MGTRTSPSSSVCSRKALFASAFAAIALVTYYLGPSPLREAAVETLVEENDVAAIADDVDEHTAEECRNKWRSAY